GELVTSALFLADRDYDVIAVFVFNGRIRKETRVIRSSERCIDLQAINRRNASSDGIIGERPIVVVLVVRQGVHTAQADDIEVARSLDGDDPPIIVLVHVEIAVVLRQLIVL